MEQGANPRTSRRQNSGRSSATTATILADARRAPSRHELGLLLVVTLLALGLRAMTPSLLAVEHFDEGVYASNLFFDRDNAFEYPDRRLYAPPLVPWLVEWSIVFFGTGVVGCFLVGITLGTATVIAVWWTGRRWLGSLGGMAAATLVALSGPMIAFSRASLTDAPLCLWWTLSVGCLFEAVASDRRRWAIFSGLATAIAWWTKYNGWVPLALSGSGVFAWWATTRPVAMSGRRALGHVFIAGAVAAAGWFPVWWGLQDHGGYAAVAANHARYFHGLAGWWNAARQQFDNLEFFQWPFATTALVGALAATAILSGRIAGHSIVARREGTPPRSRDAETSLIVHSTNDSAARIGQWSVRSRGAWLTLLIASASVAFAVARDQAALLFAAMLGLGAMSLRRGTPGDESDSRRRLGFWMLAAWLVGLLVLTPMYRPYARLMLPWWVAASLGVGGLVDTLAALSRREDQSIEERRKRDDRRCLLTVVGAVAIGLIGAAFSTDRTPADRSDLKRAVDEMRTRMLAEARDRAGSEDLAVYVYAEPAAFFHLSAGGLLAGPVGDLEFASPRSPRLPLPTFLVVGPHARRNSRFQEQWAARETRFRRIGEWEFRPSPLVLLDHYSPTEIRSRREPIGERLELYLLE